VEIVVYIRGTVLSELEHESELLFTHRLKLGFVHPPRLPGDVDWIFRSRTGRHRCSPDCFSIFLRVSSPFPSRRHQFYRCECHHLDGSLASRLMLTTHRSGIFGYSIVARPKRSPIGQSNSTSGWRQPCGYKPIHQRGAIACPWSQSL
jgi:hypothetical protein